MRSDEEIGPSRETGYAILFLGLAITYAILAYTLFSNGELKFGIAITVLMFLMAGTGAFNLRWLLKRCRAERKTRKNEPLKPR